MAIDSKNKRASAIGVCLPFVVTGPSPIGTIVAAERMQIAGEYAIPAWVTAEEASITDGWNNPQSACDDDTGTFASEDWEAGETPLAVEWPTTRTDKMRILAHNVDIWEEEQDATNVRIDLWYDKSWHFRGTFNLSKDEWREISLADHSVNLGSIKITSNNTEEYLYVGEVQILDLSSIYPKAAKSKIGGNLAIKSALIGGGLVG